ncbi:MAG: hypothetical protein GTO63_16065, partial [Anaerolineae bacterium]|nr:hypothetical protein [Anaerolineae bacterium]NIN96189.1 hypothetical protein [Anaerolineae bacterium]
VLLPKMPATALLRIWGPIGEFALNRQATVGFSRTEAEQSRKVTIVEADSENNDALASRLRQAGCQVERLTPQTGRIPEPTPKMPTDLS